MFKFNNWNTRTSCKISSKVSLMLTLKLWTYFAPCSSVSIVNFEHVIAGWEGCFFFYTSNLQGLTIQQYKNKKF